MSLRRFANNASWNLLGQIAPLLVAFVALPPLIRALGMDRYGFLSLAWVLVGYASLFDLGISRAMTRLVAQRLGQHDATAAQRIGSVATTFMLALGVVSGLLLGGFATAIVDGWLNVPKALRGEAVNAIWILAATMPVVLITSAYRGYIEAHQSFKALNIIRIVMGVFTFVGPLLATWVSPRLEVTVGAVVAMRLLAAWAHANLAHRSCGFQYRYSQPDRATARELFTLGGWMSVSNVVGPIMSYMDRFILGGLVAVELVAYYATPYDLMNRTMVLPYAVMGVLFPMLAGMGGDARRVSETYGAVVRMLFVCMFPIVFLTITLGGPFLQLWLGSNFAQQGTIVLQVLAVGVLANALAQAPANLIQGLGQPKWMAITHLIELPFFLLAIWYLTLRFGIAGTAFAWTLRTIIDCIVMFVLARRKVSASGLESRRVFMSIGLGTSMCAAGYLANSPAQGLAVAALGLVLFAGFAWASILTKQERDTIGRYMANQFKRPA
ncbi:MAG: flippase [Rhodoferax sp.]|nr:flippase [Rhodoferax sp.]